MQVAAGDELAFEKIAMRYAEKMLAHALTFVRSYALAQETVQDIFLKIWQNREKLAAVENFDDYLFIVSKNHLISAMRKKVMSVESIADDAWEEALYKPDSQYELKELRGMLEEGIAQLPEQRRQIFRMIHQEGLSQKEVAEQLGIATRTVRWNLVASINFLRDYLYRKSGNSLLCFLLFLPALSWYK